MPITFTEEQKQALVNKGFSDDDIQNTINYHREKGMSDADIQANFNNKISSWNVQQPQQIQDENKQSPKGKVPKFTPVQIPTVEAQPQVLEGRVEKNYRPNWDDNDRIHYTDENGVEPKLKQNWDNKGRVFYTDENGNRVGDYRPTLANMWKAAGDPNGYGLDFNRVQAKQLLNNRKLWEEKHPFISGIQRDYQPGYRADKELWKEQLMYGRRGMNDVPAKEIAKTEMRRGLLNLIPAANITTDILTGGNDISAKQMIKQGIKTGGIGGLVQGLTSAAGDIMQEGTNPAELLTRPLLYGGLGSAMGLGGGYVGKNIAESKHFAKNVPIANGRKFDTSTQNIEQIAPNILAKQEAKKIEKLPAQMPTVENYSNPTGNYRLPDISEEYLNELGKPNKPVVLKDNIITKNKTNHPEISVEEYNDIINNGLYYPELILQTKPKTKTNYYNFIAKRESTNDNIVIELAENKNNYEIVGWYKIDDKGLKRKINATTKNGGQSVITERLNLKGQQPNSALQGDSDLTAPIFKKMSVNDIITHNSKNFNPNLNINPEIAEIAPNTIAKQQGEQIKPLASFSKAVRENYSVMLDDDISLANEAEFWNKVNEEVNAGKMTLEDAEKLENYAAKKIQEQKPVLAEESSFTKGLKTKINNEKKESRIKATQILESITGKKLNKSTINNENNIKLLERKAVGDEVYSVTPETVKELFPGIDVNDINSQEEVIELLKNIVNDGGYSQTENEVNNLIKLSERGYNEASKDWDAKVAEIFGSSENFEKFLGDIKERGLPQSVVKAKGLPKDVKNAIVSDLPQYRALHNEDLTKRAVEEVEKNFNNELSRLTSANEFDALDYEKSRQIAKRLFDAGRYEEAVNLIDNVSINATKKGQAIQALSLWSNMTPEGAVYKAEKLIKEYNKKFTKRKAISIAPEQIERIRELQNEVLNATDDVSKAQGSARVAKYISELVPSGAGKKLKTYRNIALLLNPKTLGRNIIGNVLFNTADTVSKGLAVPFDRTIGFFTKEKTRVTPQINKLFKGSVEGAKTGFKEAVEGIDTRGLGQRFDLDSGRAFSSPVGKFFETALDIGLRVPDRMQYEATFAESVANMTKAQGLKEPTQEILERAEREALESVFQNKSKISDLVLGGRKALNNIGIKNFGLGDALIPYAQTPANLVQQGLNYSPLGYLKGVGNLVQGDQRQASLDLARATLGTGLIGSGYALGKNKLATPSQFDENYTKNRDVRNNLQKLGVRPDQIGDVWYSPFQPMSIPFATGVAAAYGNNPMQAAINTIGDLPFLQNYNRAMKDIQEKGIAEAGINFAGSLPTQFVPTGLSQVAQVVDPYQRETYDKNKLVQGINQSIAKIPYASKKLPAKIDVTGQPVERYSSSGAKRLFDIFVNPTFINKKINDPIVSELKNLYDETKETKHFLKTADKTLKNITDKNGNPLHLNGKQLSEYQKALGEKTYEEFDYTMGSDEYKKADPDEKIKILNDKRNAIKQLVEFEMFNKPISKTYKNKVKKLYINMD